MKSHRSDLFPRSTPTKTITLILIITAVVSASLVFPTTLHAQIEPGPCEWALAQCVQDAFYLQIPTDYMINCFIGYAFCKKYIEG